MRGRKNRHGERNKTPAAELLQPDICLTNVRPGEEWSHVKLTESYVSKR